jgi:hypothetical protein
MSSRVGFSAIITKSITELRTSLLPFVLLLLLLLLSLSLSLSLLTLHLFFKFSSRSPPPVTALSEIVVAPEVLAAPPALDNDKEPLSLNLPQLTNALTFLRATLTNPNTSANASKLFQHWLTPNPLSLSPSSSSSSSVTTAPDITNAPTLVSSGARRHRRRASIKSVYGMNDDPQLVADLIMTSLKMNPLVQLEPDEYADIIAATG